MTSEVESSTNDTGDLDPKGAWKKAKHVFEIVKLVAFLSGVLWSGFQFFQLVKVHDRAIVDLTRDVDALMRSTRSNTANVFHLCKAAERRGEVISCVQPKTIEIGD
jgi:hypothetical protein